MAVPMQSPQDGNRTRQAAKNRLLSPGGPKPQKPEDEETTEEWEKKKGGKNARWWRRASGAR